MRDPSTGDSLPDSSSTADLAASSESGEQDGTAEPQARDRRPIILGSREHTQEPDRNDVEQWCEVYKNNPLIRVPVQNFASDVTEPGASIAIDAADDIPTVPDDYHDDDYAGLDLDDALERWLGNAYVDGWDFDADIGDLLELIVKDRRGRRGTGIVEHAYDDPTERERVLALRPIKVETVTAYTREGKGIALRPDDDIGDFESVAVQELGDDSRDEAPKTPANKTAALAQYDDVYGADEKDEIPFALNDVTVSPYDADTGELFGRPDTAAVADRAKAVYKKLQHVDQAVLNTAFANIIAKIDTDDRDLAEKIKSDLDVNTPDTVSGTNVPVEIQELNGSVPDATKLIQQEIEYVLAAMPTPLYRVGFAGDINRDITTEQREDYRDEVSRERRRLEADFTRALEMKARDFLYNDAHSSQSLDVEVALELRPQDAESPLRDEEFDPEAFATLMKGLSDAAGSKGGADVILPQDVIVDTLLEMDADEILDGSGGESDAALAALDEDDPRVRAAFEEFTTAELTDATGVRFGNLGGDPFGDEDVLTAFLDDLDEAADGAVYLGDTEWPADDYAIHDRPVTAVGLSEADATAIWEGYADDAVALTGPSASDNSADESGD